MSLVIMGLLAGPMQLTGISHVFAYDVILQVEDMLQQAAKTSARWDSHQDAIRRDIHDITFWIQQAWKAGERSNALERKDYAEQALLLLQRATARGYFDRARTEPVRALIQGILSEPAG